MNISLTTCLYLTLKPLITLKKSLLLVAFLFTGLIQAAESYRQLEVDPQQKAHGEESFIPVESKGTTGRVMDQVSVDKLTADPERYAPAYTGQCANALGFGRGLVPIDRTRLENYHNNLYLYFSGRRRDCWLDGVGKYTKPMPIPPGGTPKHQ